MYLSQRSIFILFILSSISSVNAAAQFEPILLTTNSYNHDVVIEKTAGPPVVCVTTASMEQGTNNLGFTWFERGYLPEWPATGLPEAGSVLVSDWSQDFQYQMPPSYKTNNAFLIDSSNTNATIYLSQRTKCAALSFLTSSGISRNVLGYTVHFENGTTESGTFISRNWYSDGDPAWSANGKINVTSFVQSDLNSYNPRIYSENVSLLNSSALVESIELSLSSGAGHSAIFAVSAAQTPGGVFLPLGIRGYTVDAVVEADAVKTGWMETNSSATMQNGTKNSGFTWYEQGYNPMAPASGLPAPGSAVTSEIDGAHHFLMPPTYREPNSIFLESTSTNPVLFFAAPDCYSMLSFLTASSGGAASNVCIIRHLDGNRETNWFPSPDWMGSAPAAVTVGGRVDLSTKLISAPDAVSAKLFTADVPIADQISPITQITLLLGSNSTGRVVVFAVSGVPSNLTPTKPPTITVDPGANGTVVVHSSQPGRVQSSVILIRSPLYWRDEGPILTNLVLKRATEDPVRFYRVMVP
jgi:hypothetical protein